MLLFFSKWYKNIKQTIAMDLPGINKPTHAANAATQPGVIHDLCRVRERERERGLRPWNPLCVFKEKECLVCIQREHLYSAMLIESSVVTPWSSVQGQ